MSALKKRTLDKKTKNKIADDIVKKKGDTSKSDDRYAYESVVSGTSTNAAGEKIPWKVTTRGGKSTVSDKFGSRELRSASPKSGKKIDKMKEGYQRNPEEGERKERAAAKKGEAIRGQARRQMPPRGNKDREEFERWYAANVR